MAFTEESRRLAAEARARNRAARKEQEATLAEMEKPLGRVQFPDMQQQADAAFATDEPTSEGILADLAGLFSKAAGEKSGRDKAIDEALTLLGSLNPMKYPDIVDNPKVQAFVDQVLAAKLKSKDLPPGSIIGNGVASGKKPWNWSDLNKSMHLSMEEVAAANARGEICFPWVEYMPIKNTPIIWNGLTVYFRARQRVRVCKVFVDVFEESLNNEEFAEQHAAWLMNVDGAAVHRDFYTTNAPRLKAMNMGKGEYYHPGGGEISLAPSPDLVALGSGQ